jgi:hypothetical protein
VPQILYTKLSDTAPMNCYYSSLGSEGRTTLLEHSAVKEKILLRYTQRPHQLCTKLQQHLLGDVAGKKRDKNSSPQYATSHQLCTKLQQRLLGDVAGKKRKKFFSAIHNVPISFVLKFNSIFWETLLGREVSYERFYN